MTRRANQVKKAYASRHKLAMRRMLCLSMQAAQLKLSQGAYIDKLSFIRAILWHVPCKPNQGRPGAVYLSFIYTDAGIRNDAGICCFHTDTKGIFVHWLEL
ncbi:hypothetical protein RQP50_28070 [Paenibacillus sp. chi10]|uniref:Uncharacterized protein n=1 Tax=Paenibacillus suaedae TaxID=3077233 RepID=A0AAJ2K0B0_9BACL|nr:hypothetical protein [Paenibacillus sp. chi10]MDT8980088.1 hypothetical protein [Paenibacillus sp. chi10]